MDAWEKFKKFVFQHKLVEPGDKIVLSVSGGPDSVCMLHLFWRLKKIMPIDLCIAAFDHKLRPEAKKEINLVRKYGDKFAIPVLTKDLKVKAFSEKTNNSIETSGRILRYESLVFLAQHIGFNKIATGHNANDNAETVLMWLIRGTGLEGLSGIPLDREVEEKRNIHLLRPILSITRPKIIQYLKKQKLKYFIDRSNLSLDYTRNKIRHKLMPIMNSFNKSFVEHVFSLSQIVSRENAFLNKEALKAVKKCAKVSENKITLDLKRFFRYNKTIQFRVLKGILPEKRSQFNFERLLNWVLFSFQKRFDFSDKWHVIKSKNALVLTKRIKTPFCKRI